MKIKPALSFVWEILKLALLALIIVLPIRYFIFQPFVVKGASMEPNFHDGDYLIVDESGKYLLSIFPVNSSSSFFAMM